MLINFRDMEWCPQYSFRRGELPKPPYLDGLSELTRRGKTAQQGV
jgi:hypothetical protein